ncbi:hypothetical protein FACS1894123_11300 [Bacteroidia bacterium]|nr:hypothetical protein FACS1894123_11300 [Bacteroidia bacterium]
MADKAIVKLRVKKLKVKNYNFIYLVYILMTHKKISKMFLLVALTFSSVNYLYSQVTIGAGEAPHDFSVLELTSDSRGVRLPQLTTAQRNAWRDYFLGTNTGNPVNPSGSGVTPDELANSPGLAIFNTDTKCYEYWNAGRWVSLCEGNSLMTINPDPCLNTAADGTGCDDEFTVTDPDCPNGPFTIMIVAGQDYAALTDLNEADGIFQIAFRPNNSISQRSVVVRVTSSCTGLYKDFLFLQNGQACDATLGTAPEITSVPPGKNITFCAGGAVYLSIDETQIATPGTLDHVIWTRNNIEIARGVNNIVVTQEGKYDVWMGYVGCNPRADNTVTVTRDGTGAPQPTSIVVNGNNGMVCGPTGTTKLVALYPSGSTVLWFKNGILQDGTNGTDNITGTEVTVGIGKWFAVVQDGTCYSLPSETVSVIENLNSGGSITEPAIEKGGSFCAGSSILLSVSPTTYDTSYTYTWYENNTQIGMGSSMMYTVPSDVPVVVIRCRATLASNCAKEALTVETITTGAIPALPAITGNRVLCSGSATLNVIPAGAGNFTYAWYKDNTLIGNTQQITVTSGGDYYATVTEISGCTSPMAHINIPEVSSASPVVTLVSSSTTPGQVNTGDEVTYNADINFGPATGYEWDIPSAIADLRSGGTGYSYALVHYKATGADILTVRVTNACGVGVGNLNVTVTDHCASVTAVTPATPTITIRTTVAGVATTLGPVAATFSEGSPVASFQWYRNTTASNSGGTPILGATQNSYTPSESAVGTYYYYCMVDNSECSGVGVPVASGLHIVNVLAAPTVASVTGADICVTGTLTLAAAASAGADIRWYEAQNGGTALSTGTSFTTPSLSASKTYYVAAFITGIDYESPRTPVVANVYENRIISTNNPQTWTGNGGHNFTLTATPSAGSEVYWFTNSTSTTGGTLGNSIIVNRSSAGTTSRYARAYRAGCSPELGPPVKVDAIYKQGPYALDMGSVVTIPPGDTVTLFTRQIWATEFPIAVRFQVNNPGNVTVSLISCDINYTALVSGTQWSPTFPRPAGLNDAGSCDIEIKGTNPSSAPIEIWSQVWFQP